MSGIIGHTMYAILGGKAAVHRKLPIAPLIHRHYSSYLCGAYLGCDIQTMPEAICVDTGQEVGYGTAPLNSSPITGGDVQPWSLQFGDRQFRPKEIHRLFYGRAHIVFGWAGEEREHTVPWDHLADYAALVFQDAIELFGPGERQLAYLCGWIAHVIGDSLIKSVQPGLSLHLLDGKYTAANRPIQDLVTYHEMGRRELGINWPGLLADLAETPVEPIQVHYMRAGRPAGMLASHFPNAWEPDYEPLLLRVLNENRRYQKIRNPRVIQQLALTKSGNRWQCRRELSQTTGGLSYDEMVELADRANFRHALWQIAEAIADLLEQIVERVPVLVNVPDFATPTWEELTERWESE